MFLPHPRVKVSIVGRWMVGGESDKLLTQPSRNVIFGMDAPHNVVFRLDMKHFVSLKLKVHLWASQF